MDYYNFSIQSGKLPLKTKLLLALGLILGITLLSLFAFTFIIITLVTGAALFLVNLFQRRRKGTIRSSVPYNRHIKRDDDVIDV